MIVLITGASHTGKTLLAQRLLEKYKYPYLSIDHLKMGLIRNGNTDLTPEDDDALTEFLWPIDACYSKHIRFICLAMTSEYIESNFKDITRHASEIESRISDEDCMLESLQVDNQNIIDGFQRAGEPVMLIEDDFEKTMRLLLE